MRTVLMWLAAVCVLMVSGCSDNEAAFQGWVEGDYVHVAAPLAGELLELSVRRGDQVAAGADLFRLEDGFEAAAVSEAEENLKQAENKLADIQEGQRPTELAAIQAQLAEARASLEYARTDYKRKQALYDEATISAQELDQARTAYDQARQTVSRIASELETARLGGREGEVEAARAQVEAARAKLVQARWNLDQKRQSAPAAGLVFDTYYEPGEWVGAGKPVVSLLPPDNVKVIFYAPETLAGSLAPGMALRVGRDGTDETVAATITFVSPDEEFTPPVIYSSQNRAKLVYRVEARPDPGQDMALRTGQPVDVFLEGAPE